jgi:hypothetical protein
LPEAFNIAVSKEIRGLRNEVYTAYFDRLLAHHGAPSDDLDLSPHLFIRAQRGIVNRAPIDAEEGPKLASRTGMLLPTEMFVVLYEELTRAFRRRLDLVEPVARGLAANIEREAVSLAGLDYDAYRAAIGSPRPDQKEIVAALTTASDALYASSTIDIGFEVPFVAGYDRENGSYILIDCSVPLGPTLHGQVVPVVKLLTVHERVEKALLDEFNLRYQSAHQIALRTEKAVSDVLRIHWKAYDDLITDIANRIGDRPPARVSDRLDLQPYYSFTDSDERKLVTGIEHALVSQPRFAHVIDKGDFRGRQGRCPR